MVVELKDGRKVQGKIAFGSHEPFSKELVLSRAEKSPIRVYDPQNDLLNYGRDLELSYIGTDAIQDMHMVKDEAVEQAKKGNPVLVAASLLSCTAVFAFFMMLFALSLDGSLRAFPSWTQFFAPLTIPLLLWNLKSLGKFS